MPLGTEVGLSPDDIVLDGGPSFPMERDSSPHFLTHFALARSLISATAELLCAYNIVHWMLCFQCFDAVGWAAERASSL